MRSLAYYVPGHMIGKFIEFVKDNYNVEASTLEDDLLAKYSSEFTYGKKEEVKTEAPAKVEKEKVKTEEEVFDEVVKSKFSEIDWKIVYELIWMPAVTKDTSDNVYAIEVCSKEGVLKRIVLRDKDKSLRFLSHVNKIFMKVLNEQDKCNLN